MISPVARALWPSPGVGPTVVGAAVSVRVFTKPMCPVGTPRRVDSYPARFHAFAYDELFDQNAGYRLDGGSRPPMSRSISANGSSSRPAPDDSSRCVNPDQSATR
jgi:hypothetical protein